MSARATSSNGKTVKENICGTFVVRTTADIFEALLEIEIYV
jgi:hypothetical protein